MLWLHSYQSAALEGVADPAGGKCGQLLDGFVVVADVPSFDDVSPCGQKRPSVRAEFH